MSGFQKMDDFNEVQNYTVEIGDRQPLAAASPTNNDDLALARTETRDNDLEDHPGPLSLNPVDWVSAIRQDIKDWSWEMTERKRVLLRAVFGEGLCTFLFLFTVEATVVNNSRQETPENLVLGCISTAFVSVALIYSFADVSGAHFNPAVTFATIVTGKVSVRKGLAYIGIQLLAGIIATAYLMAVFPKPYDSGYLSTPLAVVVDINSQAKIINAFLMETTLTFILVYVIFATAFDTVDTTNSIKVAGDGKDTNVGKNLTIYTTSGSSKAGFAPVAIGFTLGFLGLLGGTVSGGAFNPARVFGPALLTGSWNNHWIYWVGDFLGAALAGFAQRQFAHEAVQSSHAIQTNKANK
ncbi:aquaporin-like protein [Polychytrium aggregatum]|uniref:aquaporin-like protein n=1 Tax=Polychytrium aggregatum TaxID=110093 RepID=UPI0022FF3B85|nr:aquaporin-like protein [Polychytrium aggregatum]KAI9204424.1 aquaporin-like protein [Polychytrium aggregatum]